MHLYIYITLLIFIIPNLPVTKFPVNKPKYIPMIEKNGTIISLLFMS